MDSIIYCATVECLLKINPNAENALLILTQHFSWPSFKYNAGYIDMPKKQSIKLVCQKTSRMNLFAYDYVDAYCDEKRGATRLEINGHSHDFSNIQCSEEVKPQVKWTKKTCYGDDSELVKIVFEVLHKSIEVFEICMDLSYDIPFYTKQNLHLPLADTVPKGVDWFNDKLKHDFDKFYDANEQIRGISHLMGHACVYSKRQLVNPLDVFPGIPQRATFTHLNVVPHWSTCASKNWNALESKVRRLAQSTNDRLIVWTGTAEYLKLKNALGYEEEIVISNHFDSSNQPVSTYLWKVVQNSAKRSSLAIVQLNIPDITPTEARKYVKCKDICKNIVWMKGTQWTDASKGYTFCCDLKDFQDAFSFKVFGSRMESVLIR